MKMCPGYQSDPCDQPTETKSSRFCAKHRQAHGRKLLADLENVFAESDRQRAKLKEMGF